MASTKGVQNLGRLAKHDDFAGGDAPEGAGGARSRQSAVAREYDAGDVRMRRERKAQLLGGMQAISWLKGKLDDFPDRPLGARRLRSPVPQSVPKAAHAFAFFRVIGA